MTDQDVIYRQDITAAIGELSHDQTVNLLALGDGFSMEELINSLRRHYLQRVMHESKGNRTQASKLLGIAHLPH